MPTKNDTFMCRRGPIAACRADEGQHDGEQHRRRLGPRRRAIEDVTGKDGPGDHRRDQDQRDAGDEDANEIQRVHRPAVDQRHDFPRRH